MAPGCLAIAQGRTEKAMTGTLRVMSFTSGVVSCDEGFWDQDIGDLRVRNRGLEAVNVMPGNVIGAAWEETEEEKQASMDGRSSKGTGPESEELSTSDPGESGGVPASEGEGDLSDEGTKDEVTEEAETPDVMDVEGRCKEKGGNIVVWRRDWAVLCVIKDVGFRANDQRMNSAWDAAGERCWEKTTRRARE